MHVASPPGRCTCGLGPGPPGGLGAHRPWAWTVAPPTKLSAPHRPGCLLCPPEGSPLLPPLSGARVLARLGPSPPAPPHSKPGSGDGMRLWPGGAWAPGSHPAACLVLRSDPEVGQHRVGARLRAAGAAGAHGRRHPLRPPLLREHHSEAQALAAVSPGPRGPRRWRRSAMLPRDPEWLRRLARVQGPRACPCRQQRVSRTSGQAYKRLSLQRVFVCLFF